MGILNNIKKKNVRCLVQGKVTKDLYDQVKEQMKKDKFTMVQIIEAGLRTYLAESGKKK